ncbi:hypothetical protein BD324DRAFT_647711 [Kockovaella imperatae]|uniref:DUF4604 domain-containing protein n=1 Tax=Kockovaella imperatae TaxID=4999 RepID=A0A1Y1URY9_9TREE|nr:hypothetical protein BD324DRAFT_647711 [Kockovaella imperatae]ORX40803.1 hypothetical protein BD324DRAFT_647711 [Kockovaella imperatae]
MPKELTRNQVSNGLTYVANTPSFLKNFGKPPPSPPPAERFDHSESSGRPGREPLPERPRDGKWAKGSDDEKDDTNNPDSDDEWGEIYGGGGEDGPQVVVLKEGRHLSADEVKRERRRAAGKPSKSPSPEAAALPAPNEKETAKPKTQIIKTASTSSKRKLVGKEESKPDALTAAVAKPKKKKKMDKGLLSFDEADGDS